jgi:hypothetical protein
VEASVNAHQVILLALLAAVAAELNATGPERYGKTVRAWSVQELTIQPACMDGELDLGCVLAAAN